MIILLPVALLLSLLFALGRMSRANEIVSMLTAGVSLPRVLLPLIGIGLLTVAVTMALNYSLAPHAELARKTFLSEAQSRPARNIQGQVFRNRSDLRTWFIQNFRLGDNMFNNVQVLQQDANDNIVMSYVAARAYYRPQTKTWDLENVRLAYYDATGNITTSSNAWIVVAVPLQSQTIARGETSVFRIATGDSALISYQWQKNGISLAGATNASYILTNAETSDTGVYRTSDGKDCPMAGTGHSTANKALNRLKNRFVFPDDSDVDKNVSLAAMLAPGDGSRAFNTSG